MGASRQAGLLTGVPTGFLLYDAVQMAFGVETAGGVLTEIITRSTPHTGQALRRLHHRRGHTGR
ncbi:Hsp70 family protein [Streptomyces sp. NPDC049837]|uniref:Hsp70 family protein n=1 Tax=Streptomyces sp. NPDC049837 TaxID=3155277 RepID=UPI003422E372